MNKKCLIFLMLIILTSFFAEAKNLYVNHATGNDSTTYANNDADHPWQTIGRAAWGSTDRDNPSSSEAAQAGDTVYIAEGIYNYSGMHDSGGHMGPPLYQPINSGSSGNWIVFQGQGSGVILTTSTTGFIQGNGGGVIGSGLGSGAEYIEFDNFIIDETNVYSRWGSGLVQIAGVDNIKIENCRITGTFASISGNNHPGIYVHGIRVGSSCSSGLSGIEIRNNTISGFTGDQGSNDAGIIMYCVESFIIDNNEIYSNYNSFMGKVAWNPVGGGSDTRSYMRKNIFRDNTKGGEFQSWCNIEITQNIFRDNTVFGIQFEPGIYYGGEAGPQDVDIVNNTFDNNGQAVGWAWMCDQLEDNTFRNNIVTNHTKIIKTEDTECESVANMGADDIDYDYNVYEHSGSFWTNDGGTPIAVSLSNHQSTYSQDTNSVDDVDCLYVEESGNDFRLQPGSPCREGNANDGVDILDLDNDGSTTDAITLGAYITGNEQIGVIEDPDTTPPATPTGLEIVE